MSFTRKKQELARLWPGIEAGLCADFGGHPTHTFDEVWGMIYRGEAQLWVSGDTCCLTMPQELPQANRAPRRFLNSWISSGKLEVLRDDILPAMEAWAKSNGFEGIIGSGRDAWGRAMRTEEFKPAYTTFVKVL